MCLVALGETIRRLVVAGGTYKHTAAWRNLQLPEGVKDQMDSCLDAGQLADPQRRATPQHLLQMPFMRRVEQQERPRCTRLYHLIKARNAAAQLAPAPAPAPAPAAAAAAVAPGAPLGGAAPPAAVPAVAPVVPGDVQLPIVDRGWLWVAPHPHTLQAVEPSLQQLLAVPAREKQRQQEEGEAARQLHLLRQQLEAEKHRADRLAVALDAERQLTGQLQRTMATNEQWHQQQLAARDEEIQQLRVQLQAAQLQGEQLQLQNAELAAAQQALRDALHDTCQRVQKVKAPTGG